MKLTDEDKNKLHDLLYGYETMCEEGLTSIELHIFILKNYPDINMDKVNDAMFGNTCPMVNGQIVNYRHDVYTALVCGLENRNLNTEEWD